ALHQLRACLGDPIQVLREASGRIKVRGLAKTLEQKEELVTALQTIPLVTAEIQTLEEAARTRSSRSSVEGASELETPADDEPTIVRTKKSGIQSRLEAYFIKRLSVESEDHGRVEIGSSSLQRRIVELSNEAILLSQAVLTEAWALRRLAESYPGEKARSMRPATRLVLETMLQGHMSNLKNQMNRSRVLLEPVLSLSPSESEILRGAPQTTPSQSRATVIPGWSSEVMSLFVGVEQVEQLILSLFGNNDVLPEGQADGTSWQLLERLHECEDRLRKFEIAVSQEFFANRDSLSLKNGTE
ncbi:MAG: hypothetical protein ACRD2L_22555, partial [Terriglobia bacterium]